MTGRGVSLSGQQMADLYVAGASSDAIADLVDRSPATVAARVKQETGRTLAEHRREHGWLAPGLSPETERTVVEALGADPTLTKAGLTRVTGVSGYYVGIVLGAHGLSAAPTPPPPRPDPEMIADRLRKVTLTGQEMADLFAAGVSGEEIARRAGCTPGRVSQLVRRATGMTPTEYRIAQGWASVHLSPEDTERVAAAARTHPGATLAWLSNHTGVPVRMVRTVITARQVDSWVGKRSVLTSQDDLDALVSAYQAGETTMALAARYGVDESTIRHRLEDANVPRRHRGPALPEGRAQELAVEAWQERSSLTYVCKKAHLGQRRARRLLEGAGIVVPTAVRSLEIRLTGQQMADLFVARVSRAEIARRAGCSPARVSQLVRDETGKTLTEHRRGSP